VDVLRLSIGAVDNGAGEDAVNVVAPMRHTLRRSALGSALGSRALEDGIFAAREFRGRLAAGRSGRRAGRVALLFAQRRATAEAEGDAEDQDAQGRDAHGVALAFTLRTSPGCTSLCVCLLPVVSGLPALTCGLARFL